MINNKWTAELKAIQMVENCPDLLTAEFDGSFQVKAGTKYKGNLPEDDYSYE